MILKLKTSSLWKYGGRKGIHRFIEHFDVTISTHTDWSENVLYSRVVSMALNKIMTKFNIVYSFIHAVHCLGGLSKFSSMAMKIYWCNRMYYLYDDLIRMQWAHVNTKRIVPFPLNSLCDARFRFIRFRYFFLVSSFLYCGYFKKFYTNRQITIKRLRSWYKSWDLRMYLLYS